MRYIVAVAAALLVLVLLAATTGFGDWPRPWGPLSRGALGGAIAIGVLIVWEQLYPREDSLTDEEKERIAAEDAQGVGVVHTTTETDDAPDRVDDEASADGGSPTGPADGPARSSLDEEDPRA